MFINVEKLIKLELYYHYNQYSCNLLNIILKYIKVSRMIINWAMQLNLKLNTIKTVTQRIVWYIIHYILLNHDCHFKNVEILKNHYILFS